MNKQLTVRCIIIGAIGSALITMGFMFVALKTCSLMGSILFVTLISMFALKMFGKTNKNEINITQTAMISGGMLAGGLAFTIPAIWIIDKNAEVDFVLLLVLTLCGGILGLIYTALLRKHFIEDEKLPFVLGEAAAETLEAGDGGGTKAIKLFSALGVSALITFLRDWSKIIPNIIYVDRLKPLGSMTGFKFSPMLLAIGYMVGFVPSLIWFLGGVIGDTGIIVLSQAFNIFDKTTALSVKESLGIGLMVGAVASIIIKIIITNIKKINFKVKKGNSDSIIKLPWIGFLFAIIVLVLTIVCNLNIFLSIFLIFGAWVACSMSLQSVGQSSVNPMEIFGIFILLFARTIFDIDSISGVYVAALITVACGVCGSVMNDYKAGHIFKTNPKDQWLGQAVGTLVGSFVAVGILYVILVAYGSESFGTEVFPSAQASIVATMVSGISNLPAFIIGIAIAIPLYFLKFPIMLLGLGVYLPFYMSITVFAGGIIRIIVEKLFYKNETGTIIAAGALGGEAFMGIIIALAIASDVIF